MIPEVATSSTSTKTDDHDDEGDRKNPAEDADYDQRILDIGSGFRRLADAVQLVVPVPAVDDPVAVLQSGEAGPVVGAVVSPPTGGAPLLVAVVGAVALSVAVPVQRHAFPGGARKPARAGRAVRFVRPVAAVCLSVALPFQRNARVIESRRTGNLVHGTGQRQDTCLSVNIQDETDGTSTARCSAVFVLRAQMRTPQILLQTSTSPSSTATAMIIVVVHQDKVIQVGEPRFQQLPRQTGNLARSFEGSRLFVRPVEKVAVYCKADWLPHRSYNHPATASIETSTFDNVQVNIGPKDPLRLRIDNDRTQQSKASAENSSKSRSVYC